MKKIIQFSVVLMLLSGCGDVPNDAIPIAVNKGPVTGIYLTDYTGLIYGTYGAPSPGGDADGKEIKRTDCIENPLTGGNSNSHIPKAFKVHHPHPNPTDDNFYISFEIPCKIEIESWAVIPGIQNQDVFQNNSVGQAIVPGIDQRIIWHHKDTFVPGFHAFSIFDYDEPGGFMRIYFKADGILAWRDVGYFNDPCLIPPGLDRLNGLDRGRC